MTDCWRVYILSTISSFSCLVNTLYTAYFHTHRNCRVYVMQWSTGRSPPWKRPLRWTIKTAEPIIARLPNKEQTERERTREASRQSLARKRWRWTEIRVWKANSATITAFTITDHLDSKSMNHTWDHLSILTNHFCGLFFFFWRPPSDFYLFRFFFWPPHPYVTMMCLTLSNVWQT